MSKILMLCNTYYQLIVAIQMRLTIFKDENVALVLSDHSRDAEKILEAIKRESLFNNCEFIQTKKAISNGATTSIIRSIKQGLFGKQDYEIFRQKYDKFIFYNLECITYSIYNTLLLYNPHLKCSRFEEGILAYDFIDKKIKKIDLVEKIRKITSKNIITEKTDSFYCFYPSIYKGTLQTIAIPRIKANGETAQKLAHVFKVDIDAGYKEKYIYFTSVYDFEGGAPIGEFEIVSRVGEIVGKENLLVKIHPRDTRGKYEREGFKVDKNSSIPWEAIQLTSDFSDKVLLSTTSGSVLAGSFLSEKPIRTIYMHKFCNPKNNTLAITSINSINNLLKDESMREALKEVYAPDKYEDILEL